MRVVVRAEPLPGERRVAAVPETVRQMVGAGLEVLVESGAGRHALVPDADYESAGAQVTPEPALEEADVLLHVRPLDPATVGRLRPGTVTVGLMAPGSDPATLSALRERGVTALAMELVPRISRAQAMDALTSQALVAGYRAVLEAAMRLPRFFPLFMTAAGTVPPARVLVLGAGVAGLQAIATAKRLGAVVAAYDVRAASAEEVRSVGATFLSLDLEALEGAGGYAREMTEERAERQRELLAPHVAESDVLITTAAVPGRRAPLLVTTAMVAGMRAGSVVVDLAAESGGNVEGSVAGTDLAVPADAGGTVTLVGLLDPASAHPVDASRLYARNVASLLLSMTADGAVVPDADDEVVAGACVTRDGAVLHEATAGSLGTPETSAVGA